MDIIAEIKREINQIEEYEYFNYYDTETKVKYVSLPEVEQILENYKIVIKQDVYKKIIDEFKTRASQLKRADIDNLIFRINGEEIKNIDYSVLNTYGMLASAEIEQLEKEYLKEVKGINTNE